MSTCSEVSLALGEQLHATAPYAPRWLLVEDPGPWGRKAVAEAGLGELEARGKEVGVRVGLVRRFGRPSARGPRRVFLVSCVPPEPVGMPLTYDRRCSSVASVHCSTRSSRSPSSFASVNGMSCTGFAPRSATIFFR